jgi:hypothetical protein
MHIKRGKKERRNAAKAEEKAHFHLQIVLAFENVNAHEMTAFQLGIFWNH